MKIKRNHLFIGSIVLLGMWLAVIKLGMLAVVSAKIQDALSDTVTIQYDTSLRGGEGAVVSPDGKQMAFCKGTQEFFVQDLTSGNITTYPTQVKVSQVKYSPDGHYLVAGRNIFNCATGQITQLETDALISGLRDDMAFSPDGVSFAIVNEQPGLNPRPKTIEIWNLLTGRLMQTLPLEEYYRNSYGYGAYTTGMAFSKDGRNLTVAGRMLTVWNIQEGKCVKTFVTKPKSQYQFNRYNTTYTSLAYSPDGKYIVTGFTSVYIREGFDLSTQENIIEIWDVERGEVVKTLDWDNRITARIMYSPNGRYLVTGRAVGREDSIRDAVWIWDVNNWSIVKKLYRFPDGDVKAIGYSEDGSQFWVSGAWHTKIWNLQ